MFSYIVFFAEAMLELKETDEAIPENFSRRTERKTASVSFEDTHTLYFG